MERHALAEYVAHAEAQGQDASYAKHILASLSSPGVDNPRQAEAEFSQEAKSE